MGHGARHDDAEVRETQLVLEISWTLGEDLTLTAMTFADFFVSAVHSVMTAHNYDAHFLSSTGIVFPLL